MRIPLPQDRFEEVVAFAEERGMKPATFVRSVLYQWIRDQRNVAIVAGVSSTTATSGRI